MTTAAGNSSSLPRRLRDGLERIAAVMRADQWRSTESAGLSATQAQILTYLASQGDRGARVTAIAEHLRVSQPTATDSVGALEKKGLAARRPDQHDRRASVVAPTDNGWERAREIAAQVTATDEALAALDPAEQAALLTLIMKLIRNLQRMGAIAPQRMCVTCRYFRAYAHNDPEAPHHCEYVNAAIGPSALRLDCGEHEPAEPTQEEAVWKLFQSGPGSPSEAAGASTR
jgi:DNA-binding MarR family transcriptional regulator